MGLIPAFPMSISYRQLIDLTAEKDTAFRKEEGAEVAWTVDGASMRYVFLRNGAERTSMALERFIALNTDRIQALLEEERAMMGREREMARLPDMPREREVICMTDLHGNMAALRDALARNGLAEEQPDGWVPTAKGLETVLIIGGDANDRGSGFISIALTLLALKDHGMDVRMLWGDHELCLRTFMSDVPLTDEDFHTYGFQMIRWQSEMQETLGEMEEWYITHGNGRPLSPSKDEQRWLDARGYTLPRLFGPGLRRQLVTARRLCTGDGPLARFFSLLEVCATQDDVLYLHALPDEFWADTLRTGSREEAVARANAAFRCMIGDPVTLHQIAFGKMPSIGTEDIGKSIPLSPIRPPAASILWKRIHTGQSLCEQYSLPAAMTEPLIRQGWSAIVRGHDPYPKGQKPMRANGLCVVNADVGLQKDERRGYTRIGRDGRVMGLIGREKTGDEW
ncbi:MAG: hypothetical protein Greene041619_254 [Candidatus Peregrinibacteria bacterium Greene0416_19]|nr:MAG: hypothetical protein Greene041619_254 [Candidatus Peregrinibacteria bacterium Greene0416_19]